MVIFRNLVAQLAHIINFVVNLSDDMQYYNVYLVLLNKTTLQVPRKSPGGVRDYTSAEDLHLKGGFKLM